MAKLESDFPFTGALGDLSAYKMKGCDKVIIRRKGGPSKNAIKNHPHFEATRANNSEWAACAKAGSHIMRALFGLTQFADYLIMGPLNGLAKVVQKSDTINRRGERAILFSQFGYLLEGFSLNRKHPFDTIVRHPLSFDIDRRQGKLSLGLPQLVPGVHLHIPWQFPVFRFMVKLSVVPDITYNKQSKRYECSIAENSLERIIVNTGWYSNLETLAPQNISLALKRPEELTNNVALVFSLGIEAGTPQANMIVTPVRHTGSAKILAVR